MAQKLLPAHEDLMQELKELEDRLTNKQTFIKNLPERAPTQKRFPRFTISTEMSCRSILGEISDKAAKELAHSADSN